MVGTSKILTVSYGTFSCTLEGFDESFNTMKAIAEYFRELAADDRYFGAEPPTPDAELLAKIAERQISRRVDARMDDDGIVLRATALTDQSADQFADTATDDIASSDIGADDTATDADDAKAAEEAAAKAAKRAKRQAAKKIARKAAKAKAREQAKADAVTAQKAADAEKATQDAKAESEAKKAAQDAKAEAEAQKAEQDAKAKAEAEAEAEAVKARAEQQAKAAAEAKSKEDAKAETVSEQVEDAGDAATDVSVTSNEDLSPKEATETIIEQAVEVPAHPDANSIAAKLQRIRAVVGNDDTGLDDETNLSDDLSEQFLPQTDSQDVADASDTLDPLAEFDAHEVEITADEADDPLIETVSETPPAVEKMSLISRIMGRHPKPEDTHIEDGAIEDVTPDVVPDVAPDVEAATDAPVPRVVHMKRAEFDAAMADAPTADVDLTIEGQDGPDLGMLDGANDLDEYLEDIDVPVVDLDILDDDGLASDLSDIANETVSDAPAEVAEDDVALILSAVSDTVTGAAAKDIADENIVKTDAEEDVSDDVDADDDITNITIDLDEQIAEDAQPHGFMADSENVDDSALDRLMSETDAQMQEPEGNRRRNAISQLKAAVAAKEAARQVGEDDDSDQDMENAFRNDLSKVAPEGTARPRPVVRGAKRTERPRPAPLKLVAAQRVDTTEVAKRSTPVSPRRVSAERVSARRAETSEQNARSFEEFADKMGARDLPDLLEAAAAYTAFVEGADEFSRPQLLRRVRTVASENFKREDGLRSFADLLNAGRFTEVRNGRFQVADDSRFNPEREAS